MIKIENLVKTFDKVTAINHLNLNISDGSIIGLVGSNGSGKSTLLRTITGVYVADEGFIVADGKETFENNEFKGNSYFIPDYPFFYNKSTIELHASYLKKVYPNWSDEIYYQLLNVFMLDPKMRIVNMSKGMQRQASLLLAFATQPKYLFLDEIFDGLDPVIRQVVKKIIINNVVDRNITVVIASHNLRELEDLCDRIVLMHKGSLVIDKNLDDMKEGFCKVQVAFTAETPVNFDTLDVFRKNQNGNIYTLTVKGDKEQIMDTIKAMNPAFMEVLPLTLEEAFISEMENINYDIKNILAM